MLRPLFVLAFATAAVVSSAATVTTSTTCGVDCNLATANVNYLLEYTDSLGISAMASTDGTAAASAFFQDSFNLVINSGAGSGTFIPCVGASTDGGSASVSFGPAGASASGRIGLDGTCGFGLQTGTPIAFVDGVTQTFLVTLSATGSSTARTANDQQVALATLGTPHFFDSTGDPLSNVAFTFIAVDAPEPGTAFLVGLALLALTLLKRALATK